MIKRVKTAGGVDLLLSTEGEYYYGVQTIDEVNYQVWECPVSGQSILKRCPDPIYV